MSQSCFSLGFFSQNSLQSLYTFCWYKGIYSRVREKCEKTFFCKIECSGDSLATRMSREITTRPDCLFLSCSVPVVMTLQLPACFTRIAFWRVVSRESLSGSNRKNLSECLHTRILYSLSHTQSLHDSHLNTSYLIAKIQTNLVQNKANTW